MTPVKGRKDKATGTTNKNASVYSNGRSYLTVSERTPLSVVHNRIEYRGEVIVAESWRPELGEEIKEDDVHFRVVLLTKPQELPPESIADPRIAVCVPNMTAQETADKRRVMKEAAIAYDTAASVAEQSWHGGGCVYTKNRLPISADEVFSLPDTSKQIDLIVSALLADICADLPIEPFALQKTLSSAEVGRIFEGFFGNTDSPEAKSALEDFAVGLGLAKPDNPYKFDPQDCAAFPILTEKLSEADGQLAISEIYHSLATNYGLTWSLITLYLLCLVYYAKPPLEIHLKPQHQLTLRSGERVHDGSLNAATVPQLSWASNLADAFESLCCAAEPSWSAVLPYARLLGLEMEATSDAQQMLKQERALAEKLKALQGGIEKARDDLGLLTRALGPLDEETTGALERLSRLAKTRDWVNFLNIVYGEYTTIERLAQDLSLYDRLQQLVQFSDEMVAAKAYLDGAVLRDSDLELAMDRMSIQGQISLQSLLPNPSLWASVKTLFDWFKSRYRILYQAHHRRFHQEVDSLRLALEGSKLEVDALRRLNSIPELGKPLGGELPEEYQRLVAKVRPCSLADAKELPLDIQPLCPRCGLMLTSEPPTKEVERFIDRLRRALRGQYRRLSSEAMRKILARRGEERIDQFIKVIQTSDLSSLVNVMDDELVDFLRHLLSEAAIE